MTDEEKKKCFYYDKNCNDGCCTCAECYIEKCSVAVDRMTEKEKKFYRNYKRKPTALAVG